jgi:hypothetical protein
MNEEIMKFARAIKTLNLTEDEWCDYIQAEFNYMADDMLGAIIESRMLTDAIIEKMAEEHAKFIGFGGHINYNLAKQVSFEQGMKACLNRIKGVKK